MSKRFMGTYKTFRYLQGVTTLRFSSDKCISCGRCIEVCPHAVFGRQNGKVVLQDRNACMECGACTRNCPVSAIEVRAGVGCAYAVLASKWFRRLPWRKKSSQKCSCCMPNEEPSSDASICGPAETISQDSSFLRLVQKSSSKISCCGEGGCGGS